MTQRSSVKTLFHSLYFRLLGTFGLTFVLIVASIAIAFKLSRPPESRGFFSKNIHQYADYLVKDIGIPPDLTRAEALHAELGIDLLIVGAPETGIAFHTNPRLQHTHERHCAFPNDASSKEWRRCGNFHEIRVGNYHYVLSHPQFREPERLVTAFSIGVLLVLLALFFSFRIVQRILRPVKKMQEAAAGYADGNWKVRLQEDRDDELGQLARTMNDMAGKIDGHFRSVKELLIAISHELRSPLARMKVALESVQNKNIRQSMNEEITLLDKITANLLEKERLDSRPDLLDLKETLLNKWIRAVAKPYGDRLKLRLTNETSVSMDTDRMTVCLRNLIENALRYSDGEVEIIVEYRNSDNEVSLGVRDHGPGIRQEDLPFLTDPFFKPDALQSGRTGSRKQGGFGLGLSLCQSIVAAHGGNLEIESQVGRGTTVWIRLQRK